MKEEFKIPYIDIQNVADLAFIPFEPVKYYEQVKSFVESSQVYLRSPFKEFYIKYNIDFSFLNDDPNFSGKDAELLNCDVYATVRDYTDDEGNVSTNIKFNIDYNAKLFKTIRKEVVEAREYARSKGIDVSKTALNDKEIPFSDEYEIKYDSKMWFEIINSTKRLEDTKEVSQLFAVPILYSIVLMHCKNVTLVEEPDAKMKRFLSKHKRKPSIIYKVIDIVPFRNILKKDHNEDLDKAGLTRAIHLCRGHLRTYDEIRPMFGKLAGTFFIPAHARGNKEKGKVEKDYKMKFKENL
ncbi:MAG: hypothetical protein M0R03_17135 [Novosphingobium sp.]|nr:hypothetical protein [Novosphingobium sp.]